MKLTKYEHACFTVEKEGRILVVDPGILTTDFITPENIIGIIITHEHGDHFDHEHIEAIIDKNPDAIVIGPETITSQIEAFETKTVSAGDKITLGKFDLEFFGSKHALIHNIKPQAANVGVMINDLLYFPGDSFTLPMKPVDTLAIPLAAPWMKMGEAMDFLVAINPRLAFPTHDAILSESGKELSDRWIAEIALKNDTEYKRLEVPIEI